VTALTTAYQPLSRSHTATNTTKQGKIMIVEFGTKKFAFSVVLGSNPVVAHMMATGGLHGR